MRDLAQLLTQPEGQYFERKSLWHGPRSSPPPRNREEVRDEIAEYVAAFANADGGTLILGQEDDGEVTGHGYPPEAVEDMLRVPERRLRPPQQCGVVAEWQGKKLLLFQVAAAERAVQIHGGGFPRRVHEEVFQESEEVINAIKTRGRHESVEADLAQSAQLQLLNGDLIRRAQQGAGLAHLTTEQYLVERRLADRRGGEVLLRRGAVLLFGREPATIDHPNAGVRIFRVQGTVRLTGAQHNVEELPRIEGALPEVIRKAYEVIGGLIRRSTRLHDLFFREMPEYPSFAWQEALVNAVAHRDYRVAGQSVEVWLFDDRLEVRSPGPLPEQISVEELRRREPVHLSRNPRMARVLAELALMREQGEGIPRMFEEMERSWLRLPELLADPRSFTVVLRNQPIFESPDPSWVRHVGTLPVGTRQRRILIAYPATPFASADYQALNEVDRDVAYREVKELVALGLIEPLGRRGRGAKYRVVSGGHSADAPRPAPRRALATRMAQQGFLKNADYRDIMNVGRPEAMRALKELSASGVVVPQGERRGRRYVPGPEWDRWVAHP
jgi:ATP-dependent DNA helicase RecG